MKITTTSLSHLGIVAGIFDELGIADVIDSAMPKNRDHNIPHSTVIKAMCLNGLGFNESRLYLYAEYFEDLPTERLLGEGVLPEHLNDDALGRTLDRIYEYGCTEIFNQIVLKAMGNAPFGAHVLHTDTTNFSVHGDYENPNPDLNTIEITYGHPKDKRWDLKRFVLSMVCNQEGIPLFVKALSGNASDKTTLVETVKKIQNGLKLNDKVYHIADSAIYSADNITELGAHTLWITRVPATITEAKDLLDADVELNVCTDPGYSYYETKSSYGGMEQKWALIQSEEMKKRKEKTFDSSIEKDLKAAQKSLNKLKKMEYACCEDANRAAESWLSEHKRYRFKELAVEEKSRRMNGKRGRPKKGEELETYYLVKVEIEVDEQVIAREREKLGRFILATNDPCLTVDEILSYYKSQSKIERGFRFLKDKSFHVSEVYLKKESRIEALTMIMVLCLFLYSIAQWMLRKRLKETNKFVRNQVKKPIQNPTMRWVFFLFRGVTELTIRLGEAVERKVANMSDELWDILSLMGEGCEKYYV
jgi:transposase